MVTRRAGGVPLGLWQYPNGREFYKYLVRFYTTLDISPQQVHSLGLVLVKETVMRRSRCPWRSHGDFRLVSQIPGGVAR